MDQTYYQNFSITTKSGSSLKVFVKKEHLKIQFFVLAVQ